MASRLALVLLIVSSFHNRHDHALVAADLSCEFTEDPLPTCKVNCNPTPPPAGPQGTFDFITKMEDEVLPCVAEFRRVVVEENSLRLWLGLSRLANNPFCIIRSSIYSKWVKKVLFSFEQIDALYENGRKVPLFRNWVKRFQTIQYVAEKLLTMDRFLKKRCNDFSNFQLKYLDKFLDTLVDIDTFVVQILGEIIAPSIVAGVCEVHETIAFFNDVTSVRRLEERGSGDDDDVDVDLIEHYQTAINDVEHPQVKKMLKMWLRASADQLRNASIIQAGTPEGHLRRRERELAFQQGNIDVKVVDPICPALEVVKDKSEIASNFLKVQYDDLVIPAVTFFNGDPFAIFEDIGRFLEVLDPVVEIFGIINEGLGKKEHDRDAKMECH